MCDVTFPELFESLLYGGRSSSKWSWTIYAHGEPMSNAEACPWRIVLEVKLNVGEGTLQV